MESGKILAIKTERQNQAIKKSGYPNMQFRRPEFSRHCRMVVFRVLPCRQRFKIPRFNGNISECGYPSEQRDFIDKAIVKKYDENLIFHPWARTSGTTVNHHD